MELVKKVAIFDWEWDRYSAPRERRKIPEKVKNNTVFKRKALKDYTQPVNVLHWLFMRHKES